MAASNVPQLSVFGPANGPTIVLMHGSAVTHAMWQPQIEALADEFRIVTFDLPGHGVNASLPFTMQRAVAWTDAALATSGDGPAVVVGISLGGYVAIAHAAQHQRNLAGLVLASTTINFTGLLGAYVRVVGWALSRVPGEEMQRAQLVRGMRRKYAQRSPHS
jgi:pimeloyl-ACP methyl ester carboxylesterase